MLSFIRSSLWRRELLPLWVGMFSIVVVPFLSIYRVGPLSSFYLESGSLLLILFWVLWSAGVGCLKVALPRGSVYFLLLALFWAVQARVMGLAYPGLSDMVAWSFVVFALACWAGRGWVLEVGQERVLSVLAVALVVGGVLQSVVAWLQYTGLARWFSGYLMFRQGVVEGQLAQRNHLGHYVMWGVLSVAWLWSQRRLAWWWAVLLLGCFASVLALTGSRTVLAYVLALAVFLPVAWLWARERVRRLVVKLLVGLGCVLLFQLALEPLLAWWQLGELHGAVGRLKGASFAVSGRGYEWQKAWLIFLSAPWFGYGWGSYALQGFLVDVYPSGFRPYETNVLFTHSHNSFLNLLVEMGLVGTLLVLGGLLWTWLGCLKRDNAVAGLFLTCLASVSLIHSFFEFPLWYGYFMGVFALFVAFVPPVRLERVGKSGCLKGRRWWGVFAVVVCVLLMVGIVRLAVAYQELRKVSQYTQVNVQKRAENVAGLLKIAKTEPMLRYYAQLQLMSYVTPELREFPVWAEEASAALTYRPFASAYKWSLVAMRLGKVDEARNWMRWMYRYYPSKMQVYGKAIMGSSEYEALRADYWKYCYAYYATLQQLPVCVSQVNNSVNKP